MLEKGFRITLCEDYKLRRHAEEIREKYAKNYNGEYSNYVSLIGIMKQVFLNTHIHVVIDEGL